MEQREIKFRAWDKEAKKMRYWDQINQYPMYHLNDDHVDHMQYTGLRDAKGVEIYEGDIVRGCGGEQHPRQVIWRTGYPGWAFYAQKADGFETGFGISDDPQRPGVEIIGNIYENPELLK